MCILTDNHIDCIVGDCCYPASESRYINDGTLNHDSTQGQVDKYISECDDLGIHTNIEDNPEG